MLTTRGFYFFLAVFSFLAAATILSSGTLMLICLTMLLWFLGEWALFLLRIRLGLSKLLVQRTLHTSRGTVDSIWTRQKVEVVVGVRSAGFFGFPYVVVTDRLPAPAELQEESLRVDGPLTRNRPILLRYHMECRSPGRLRFEGVKVQIADLQGFFSFSTFLRDACEYRVLPPLTVEASQSSFVKQHNALPLLGAHRHRRPGSGSELLDLRDYIPGDPPKTIAWKLSARRDRLITKEFESEVPIRCTLFVDVSDAVRVGPVGETALGRLVEIAVGLAQANTSTRDLTGLCLFDETGVRERIAPGRGAKHLLKMLDVLTHAASLVPCPPRVRLRELLPIAYGLLQDLYPDWLDRDVNYFPSWLPFWAPQPYSTIPQPPIPSGRWWQWPWIWLRRRIRHSFFTLHNRRGTRFSAAYHREYRWRKQIAAVLAVHYQLGPGGLASLLEDDQECGLYVQRFLAEHQVAYPYPLYDEEGRYLFAAPEKAGILAHALLRAITHGRDNELFVLCVDLLESTEHLAVLERAICVAKARHHQVVVICPWPSTVDVPGKKPPPGKQQQDLTVPDLYRLLLRAGTLRLHEAFARMQRAFGRLGVPVICAAQSDTVDWIIYRMRRLRIQERGVR